MKRLFCFLLAALMLLSLMACNKDADPKYRILEVVGKNEYAPVFRSGDKLAEIVGAAMKELAASGSLSSISRQHLGGDWISLKGDGNAIENLAEAPAAERSLVVGVARDAYPLSYKEDGEPKGMSADIAYAIGEMLGWEIRLQIMELDEVEVQLSSGNVDCAIGFSNRGLGSTVQAGDVYMSCDIVVVSAYESKVKKLKHLKGETVSYTNDPAVVSAAKGSEELGKFADSLINYATAERCMRALDDGRCAAAVVDRISLGAFEAFGY